MEGSVITVVEPSKCRTSIIRKIKGENPRDQERRSYKIPGALPKESQSRFWSTTVSHCCIALHLNANSDWQRKPST